MPKQAENIEKAPLVTGWVDEDMASDSVEQDTSSNGATSHWNTIRVIAARLVRWNAPSQGEDIELLAPEERKPLIAADPSPKIDVDAVEGGARPPRRRCRFSKSVAINAVVILLFLVVAVGGTFLRHYYGH